MGSSAFGSGRGSRLRRRVARGCVAALLAGATCLPALAGAGPAQAVSPCATDPRDVVAGAPRYASETGAVDVHRWGAAPQLVTRATLGLSTGEPGDRFGAAVATEQAGNGCPILVIGAPGVAGLGVVYVAVATASGYGDDEPVAAITAPRGAVGDRFGETLVMTRSVIAQDEFELWIGAPRRDIGSAVDAGAVEHYRLALTPNSGGFRVVHIDTLIQGTATLPGTTAEPNDRLGEVLAPSNRGLVIGVPHENVGSAVDAGMVTMVGFEPETGRYGGTQNITQDTPKVPGTVEAGDLFGASLAPCGRLIGAPGEDVDGALDAGLVQVLLGCWDRNVRPGIAITQASPRVPGTPETGDRLGASVAIRAGSEDGEQAFIGVPGEDLGSTTDAGLVLAEIACGEEPCAWQALSQGDGIPGTAESGDRLGESLFVRHFYDITEDGAPHSTTWPLVGAPGEDVGSVVDAGVAYGRRIDGGTVTEYAEQFSDGPTAGLRFGTVFASDTYGYPEDN